MTKYCTRKNGFTLIELMIVVAVIGIIAAIAYPSYIDSVRKSRRAEAKTALMEIAQKMESFYARNGRYTKTDGSKPDLATDLNAPTESENGYYSMEIDSATTTTYTLKASPKGDQANDKDPNDTSKKITAFYLSHTGEKTYDGSASDTPGWP